MDVDTARLALLRLHRDRVVAAEVDPLGLLREYDTVQLDDLYAEILAADAEGCEPGELA